MCALSQAEVKKLDLMFEGDSARDASSGIRGFLFQDYVAIQNLLDPEVDYVCSEYLEDVDVFYKDGRFKFIQVKYYPKTNPTMNEISTDLYYQYLRLLMLNSGLHSVPTLYIHRKGKCRDLNIKKMKKDVQKYITSGKSLPKKETIYYSANEEIWLRDHVHVETDKDKQKEALFRDKAAEDTLTKFIAAFKVEYLPSILDYKENLMENLSLAFPNSDVDEERWLLILLGLAMTYIQRRYMTGASSSAPAQPNNSNLNQLRVTRDEFKKYINQSATTKTEQAITNYLVGRIVETYGILIHHNDLTDLQLKMLNRIYQHTIPWIAGITETADGQYQMLNTLSKDEASRVARYNNKSIEGKLTSIAECKDAFREFLKYLWKIMLNICQEQIHTLDEMDKHPELFNPATYHVKAEKNYLCLKFPQDVGIDRSIILPPTNDFPGDKRRVVERMLNMNEKPQKWFFRNTDLKPGENLYDYSTANIRRKPSITDLGRNSFYIECMDCIKTREGDWDKVEKCSDCIFSEKCVKEEH